MWKYLLHLGAYPSANLKLECPPPPPGDPADIGFFDPAAIASAYQWIAVASVILVLAGVLALYLSDSRSLSLAFVRRWWGALAATSLLGAMIPFGVLYGTVPQHALAGSCDTNPLPFARDFPIDLVLARSAAGLLWCAAAFAIFSFLLTRVAGWHPASRGFFHNRGCPWPRVNPFGA